MIKLSAALVICALLSGCNGFPKPFINDPVYSQYQIINSGPPLPMMYQASAIQWNEDYAVTAKHTPFLWNVAHKGRGDLVFFPHKSNNPPQWRQYIGGETLTSVGFSPLLMSVKSTGKAKKSRIQIMEFNDNVSYAVGDMALVKGMSGGPVFGEDNRVVGINIGFISESGYRNSPNPEIAGTDRLSIFMPYDEILTDWNIFMKEKAGADTTPSATPAPASN